MKEPFTFHLATPDVQVTLREAGCTEGIKWMKFNAGVILSDEEVRQPTEAGRENYPMKLGRNTVNKKRVFTKR